MGCAGSKSSKTTDIVVPATPSAEDKKAEQGEAPVLQQNQHAAAGPPAGAKEQDEAAALLQDVAMLHLQRAREKETSQSQDEAAKILQEAAIAHLEAKSAAYGTDAVRLGVVPAPAAADAQEPMGIIASTARVVEDIGKRITEFFTGVSTVESVPSSLTTLAEVEQEEAVAGGQSTTQSAFVFTKPHANTPAVRDLVLKKFNEVGIEVVASGSMTGATIDSQKHKDQHYYAIASKATLLKPDALPVPASKFRDAFGEDWQSVLADGRAKNALDACEHLGIDEEALGQL